MMTKSETKLKRNTLMTAASACIGCNACMAACKLENDLPAGPRPIVAIHSGPLETDNGLMAQYWPATCFHCDQPACVLACPTDAMQKREDGLVFSDIQLCIGCQTCAVACPFGHPQLNPSTGKIAKCDGCRNRVDAGLWPSCALVCPTGALSYGSAHEVVHQRRMCEAVKTTQTFTPTKC
ncbi:MAG: 4Fe-4S dicluster domain-containing protein [Desulfobacteraceae bacterium]|jgi:Fe-S-cluster-containing dehydrogenase component